ncbi:MAG: heme biosynthesis HemY N-terminal domain-containing protein, partial [Gammaproteobacteria bacterium]
MTRTFALAMLFTVLGAAAAVYLREESGYVLVSWRHWILETSLLGLVASVLLALGLLYGAARGFVALLRLPATIRETLAQRRAQRAQQSFESGLMKLLEGQWASAEVELVRRAADHPAPALNYLLAARAAQRAGIPVRRDQYLELAAKTGEGPGFATQLLRAELQLEQDPAAAIPVLQDLRRRDPAHPYVIELLARALDRAGAWEALRQLLTGIEAPRALPPAQYRELYARALREALAEAAASARLDGVKALWESAPVPVRADAEVRRAYVRALARLGAETEAAAQIAQLLDAEWDGALVAVYGELEGLDPVTQLATVERWVNQQGEQPDLLLAAGRVCMRNQLWGKARSYFDGALRLQPTPAAFLALARLCELTQQADDAALFHRRGLELAAGEMGAGLDWVGGGIGGEVGRGEGGCGGG